jgi:hypothetical protein
MNPTVDQLDRRKPGCLFVDFYEQLENSYQIPKMLSIPPGLRTQKPHPKYVKKRAHCITQKWSGTWQTDGQKLTGLLARRRAPLLPLLQLAQRCSSCFSSLNLTFAQLKQQDWHSRAERDNINEAVQGGLCNAWGQLLPQCLEQLLPPLHLHKAGPSELSPKHTKTLTSYVSC